MTTDTDLIETVDLSGATLGTIEKLAAHEHGGTLHRALSVFLFDCHGRLLVQRRSLQKYHFPGLWANSCCSHPRPNEIPLDAAERTCNRELGIRPFLFEVGALVYRAEDPESGLTEWEYDHIFVGAWDGEAIANPTDVLETQWITALELQSRFALEPQTFAPWLGAILRSADDFQQSDLTEFSLVATAPYKD